MAIATPNEIGGYEDKFVETVLDRYVCNICHLPSRDPYLSVCCGHVFCKSCLENVKKAVTISNACPVCRDDEFVTFPNKQLDREVKSLHVMCTNKERGCEWQGELNDIDIHLVNSDGCQFESVNCSYECGKMLQRQYLTGHVKTECPRRIIDCQYCHITGEHQFIEGEHKERCPKLPIPCPNKCELGSVPREGMEVHKKECPLEMVQCEYHNVGCEQRMMRKRKRQHEEEKMEEHLSITNRRLADTHSQLNTALEQINTLMVILHQTAGQTASRTHAVSTVSVAQWWAKLTAMSLLIKSGDQLCPVTMNITKFSRRKGDHLEWCSDSFYSHDKGYKMCLCVYPADLTSSTTDEDTHMSVYLCLMKGPHDDELTWPLRGKFEVKLLNQISDCEHHSETIAYDDRTEDDVAGRVTDHGDNACGWGREEFICNEDLHQVTPTCQYLKDDCIFLQVSKL